MIDKLLASPLALIAFILIVAAAIGFVSSRRPSVKLNRTLWILLAAGIGLMLYAAFRPVPAPPPPPEPLTGDVTIPAYGSVGMPFQNYMNFPVTFEFVAEGQWSMSELPGSITDAGGKTEVGDERYTLPGAPTGGLIMQRVATGAYEYIGNKKTVEFIPHEKVLFLMNDFKTEKAYADNTGFLKLRWACFNCIPLN